MTKDSAGYMVLCFVIAFAIALAGVWAALALQARSMLSGGGVAWPWFPNAPLLVGMALFQLVFGFATGLWRGWRYWVFGGSSVFLVLALAIAGIWRGFVTPAEAMTLAVFTIFVGGLALALRSRKNGRS